jgi:DNA-binding XRE family transcriptional regulator
MARGPLKTAAELRLELAAMKAKYDQLADEVRAALDAVEGEQDPVAAIRRLRTRVRFGGKAWTDSEITGAAMEWAHRHGSSPTATDWNPAMLRAKGGRPDALERYLDGDWPSTPTVLRHFGQWSAMLTAAGLPDNEAKRGHKTREREPDDLAGLPEWDGWELIEPYRQRAGMANTTDLARAAGLNWITVRNVERGESRNPTIRVVLALARGLGVRPEALL